MALIADILLAAGALAAGLYCAVLSRRLRQFARLEDGMGGAIAVLSAQVDDMTRALRDAQSAAQGSEAALAAQTERAERATERLSLMLAALNDLPAGTVPDDPGQAPAAGRDTGRMAASGTAGDGGDPPGPDTDGPGGPRPGASAPEDVALRPGAAQPDAAAPADGEADAPAAVQGPRRLRFVRRRSTASGAEAAE